MTVRLTAGRDDGFQSVEYAIVFPLLLAGLLSVVNVALWAHAQNAAGAAAAELATSVAWGDVVADVDAISNTYGLGRVEGIAVTVHTETSNGDRVVASVRGRFRGLLVGLPVSGTASVPVERFRP